MSLTLVLSTIQCVATTEPGLDEIFLTYRIDGGETLRIPATVGSHQQLPPGGNWRLYQAFTFSESLEITVWELDLSTNRQDQIGTASYAPDNAPEETTISGHGGEYRLIARPV